MKAALYRVEENIRGQWMLRKAGLSLGDADTLVVQQRLAGKHMRRVPE